MPFFKKGPNFRNQTSNKRQEGVIMNSQIEQNQVNQEQMFKLLAINNNNNDLEIVINHTNSNHKNEDPNSKI